MTAGGAGSVVICRSELLGGNSYPATLDRKAEQSVRDGLAWLGLNFRVDTNPGSNGMAGPHWHHYYLYGLERAGVLAGVDWMGRHDWYGEGAEYLLGTQREDGSWVRRVGGGQRGMRVAISSADHCVTTCFALLFLKRGTAPVARGAVTRGADDTVVDVAAAAKLSDRDFEDLLDLVLSRWRRAGSDEARDRLLSQATKIGPRIVLPLVMRLDSTKDPEREGAIALLRRAVGFDHGYDPLASRDRREEAIGKWQTWWLANREKLRYEPEADRIVADTL
jgi:hypothetical protein